MALRALGPLESDKLWLGHTYWYVVTHSGVDATSVKYSWSVIDLYDQYYLLRIKALLDLV